MILIASSFSLLVIVAGMFLLAKTQKDGLSNMFKYVSYFVILSGFFSLFAGSTAFIVKRCMMHCQMQNRMQCERNNEHCSHWKHHGESCGREEECEGGMKEHCDGMNEEKCMEMKNECCSEMKNEKCMKGNMIIKKDTIVIKK